MATFNVIKKSIVMAVLLNLSLFVAGNGTQFITGPCTSDADCASGCCGFNTGLCAGAVIALTRDGGCGRGDATPNNNAAVALIGPNAPLPGGGAPPAAANNAGSGKPPGTQFITGPCGSDADCASGCCGFNTGLCAGAVIALTRDGGCGRGDATPNNNAAVALIGPNAPLPGGGAPAAANNAAAPPPAASGGSGKPPGTQFITGPCGSDADCASGCCGFNTGLCAGAVIALTRDGGCGRGDATPNNNAAVALIGPNAPLPGGGAPPAAANNAAASTGSGKPPGTQFITGPCGSDADCASGCCGFNSGLCAGAIIAQTRDGGCGRGDAQPNDNAAQKLRGKRYVKKELLWG